MTPPVDAIRTRTCALWCENGIVHGQFYDGAEVSLEDARENLSATGRLTQGQRRPVLVDWRAARSQSAEARALFAGPAATAVTVAVALVTSSPLSRVLGNFFLGFNRPETPARLFTSVEAARVRPASLEAPHDGR